MKKRIIGSIFAMMMVGAAFSQNGVNSPYSQFGLGALDDQSQGYSRGMNGVGLALRKGNVVNTLNPASYSAVDSLTMLFDIALSGQFTTFKEGKNRSNVSNAEFSYAVGMFRLLPHVGVSVGVLPFSSIGYDYSTTSPVEGSSLKMTDSYTGSGGFHKLFLGAGWRIFKPLSVGFNASYLWGTYDRTVASVGSESQVKRITKTYSASVRNYDLEFGLQWQQPLSKKDELLLGAVVGIGHKLGTDPSCDIMTTDPLTSVSDTTSFSVANALQLPMRYGVGLAWSHNQKWHVEADFVMQKWAGIKFPVETNGHFDMRDDVLKNSYKANIGFDYLPAANSRRYFDRVHYRFGAGFATPYYKIYGADGPKEFSVSAGIGLPLQNGWNNRSVLNISGQWVHASSKGLITENTFRLNIGITFNEKWFAKWKID